MIGVTCVNHSLITMNLTKLKSFNIIESLYTKCGDLFCFLKSLDLTNLYLVIYLLYGSVLQSYSFYVYNKHYEMYSSCCHFHS